jgi:outer membrane protein assembly factor BamE (lipoprotein component of BamABCDE complex)
MMRLFKRTSCADVLILALISVYGCVTSPQFVSETIVEDKIARLKIGQTGKSEVEIIFGPEHGYDRNRWVYQFADTQFEITHAGQAAGNPAIPIAAGVVPTNTRALVTVTFNEAGIAKRIEVARFFGEPFINDYWYLVKETTKEPLQAIADIAESAGLKVGALDAEAGTLGLEYPGTKARMAVKLAGQIVRITSTNPHNRTGIEYRVYSKRENAFTNSIAESDLVQ